MDPPSPSEKQKEDAEELNSVVESISHGKPAYFKKVQLQAFSAAISSKDQIPFVINYLKNPSNPSHLKFQAAKHKFHAFRVNEMDAFSKRKRLEEGFEDDGEDGAG